MPLSTYFWVVFLLALLGGGFAGWGSARGYPWGWGVPLTLILILLLILALRVFGGPIQN